MAELLTCANITKRFGGLVAIDDVSFSIREGETLGFIGPNGAGKSTMVNVMSGYLKADAGRIVMGCLIKHQEDIIRSVG